MYRLVSPPSDRNQEVSHSDPSKCFSCVVRNQVDRAVLYQMFADEHYRLTRLARGDELSAVYESIVSAGRTPLVIDCGANIGLSAKYFSLEFPDARIIAIEPEKENMAQARRNCPSENVHFRLAAVASHATRGSLYDPGQGSWAFRVEDDGIGDINMISIDDLLLDPVCRDCVPFIVKIDIEGGEGELFSQNTSWIDRFPLLVIELHDWMLPGSANSATFLQAIAHRSRDFVYLNECVFSIANSLTDR